MEAVRLLGWKVMINLVLLGMGVGFAEKYLCEGGRLYLFEGFPDNRFRVISSKERVE